MPRLSPATKVEQVAEYLREGIRKGRWQGQMPGREQLSRELQVSPMTVVRALKVLEVQQVLAPQGTGRRRQILMGRSKERTSMRVMVMPYDADDAKLDYCIDLQHQLLALGHTVSFASRSMMQMGMDVKKVARHVEKTEADVWIVIAGTRDILTWFSQQPFPTYALFGRFLSLSMPGGGPVKSEAIAVAVRRLADLGHQRIVMLARDDRRKPVPGIVERRFLEELQTLGIPCGPYNLPDWEDGPEGFQRCLDSLFRHTPPTALIIQTTLLFNAAQQYLARRGIVAPEQISMICTDPDVDYSWCKPSIAHIDWDSKSLIKQVARWVDRASRGQHDKRHTMCKSEFVEGGTIGQAPKGR